MNNMSGMNINEWEYEYEFLKFVCVMLNVFFILFGFISFVYFVSIHVISVIPLLCSV